MTPKRALKILNHFIKTGAMQPEPSFTDATKLGIEALKRLHVLRLISTNEATHLLPGETEE